MKSFIPAKTTLLLASTAIIAGFFMAQSSLGDTVTKQVTTTTTNGQTVNKTRVIETPVTGNVRTQSSSEQYSTTVNGARGINFMDFDLSKDGILSINEIAEMLFKLYDTDGNNLIDNIEYERRTVLTIMPVEKNTVVYYDFDGDGKADQTKYTYETFTRDTQLTRFDENRDGLSPREFTSMHFNQADVNNDHLVDLEEWRGTYIPSIDKANKKAALFNK